MFFQRIFTDSLAHYSYMIGEGEEIVVIDPQPDIQIYLDKAKEAGMKITKILETHRNEDFAVGSRALSIITNAKVYISDHEDLEYTYGNVIKDRDTLELGNMIIKAVHTPGHTLGHMSYVLYLEKDRPYMIFTGDALFTGDIGRTDFYGEEELDKMTGYLYDSIFNKILPLGDHVILCPAHGAGSACGGSIEDRPFTTLGYERKFNPKLQYNSKKDFIENVGQMMHKPKYFNTIEDINLKGIDRIDCNIDMNIVKVDDIKNNDNYLVDIRGKDSYSNAHIPNALYIPRDQIGSYIGLFVPTDAKVYFITNSQDKDFLNKLYLDLRRMGYKNDIGFISGGMDSWYSKGEDVQSVDVIHPEVLKEDINDEAMILDVREEESLQDSIDIPLEELDERIEEIPKEKTIYLICSSGYKSTIAASLLKKENRNPVVVLGGIQGWNSSEVAT